MLSSLFGVVIAPGGGYSIIHLLGGILVIVILVWLILHFLRRTP